jgi:hypothetical protein
VAHSLRDHARRNIPLSRFHHGRLPETRYDLILRLGMCPRAIVPKPAAAWRTRLVDKRRNPLRSVVLIVYRSGSHPNLGLTGDPSLALELPVSHGAPPNAVSGHLPDAKLFILHCSTPGDNEGVILRGALTRSCVEARVGPTVGDHFASLSRVRRAFDLRLTAGDHVSLARVRHDHS